MSRYDEKMKQIDDWSRRPDLEAEFKNPASLITDAELDKIEQELGHPLPKDYREFLRGYSGYIFFGTPEFPLINGGGKIGTIAVFSKAESLVNGYKNACESEWPLSLYGGISLLRPLEAFELEYPDSDGEPWIRWPKELLPIANNNGSATICLAISGIRTGSVYYWFDNPGSKDMTNVYLLSDTFDDFLLSMPNATYEEDAL